MEQRQLLAGGFTDAQGQEFSDIQHPNGNVYDQVLLKTSTITVTNDDSQITRVSFLDLQGDIVQAEFSGAGSLTISLDGFVAAAEAENYNQPGVEYVSGLASFTIQGSDASTYFSVFTVGTATAWGGAANSIFDGGLTGGNNTADVARLTIVANPANPNGSAFGGIGAGNAIFSDDEGTVGISAANIQVQSYVRLGDINATGTATPTLRFGDLSQFSEVVIAGGDLLSANGAPVNNADSYAYNLTFAAGTTSGGTTLPAATTSDQVVFTDPNELDPLTTAVDTVTGGSGSDTLSGDNTTLTVFDNIDLGGGKDTFNLLINAAVAALPAGISVESAENVNIAAVADFAGDISDWDGVTNLTVLQAAADDLINVTSAVSEAITITNPATTAATSLNDDDVPEVTLIDLASTAAATLLLDSLETLNLEDLGAQTLNLTTSSEDLAVNATGNGGTTILNDVGGDVVNLALELDDADLTVNAAVAETVAITLVDDSTATLNAAAVTDLTLDGSGDLTLAGTILTNVLETLTISGSIGLNADLSGLAALEEITSTSTGDLVLTIDDTALAVTLGSGDDEVTQAAALDDDQVINLGAGDDVIILAAVPGADATVDGGAGTDGIAVVFANIGTDHSDNISNFEGVGLTDALAAGTLDVGNFDDVNEVHLEAGFTNAASAIDGLATGAMIFSEAAGGAAAVLTLGLADDGDADEVTVNLSEAAAADFGSLDVSDIEVLNLNVNDTAAGTLPAMTVGIVDDDLTNLVLGQTGEDDEASIIIDTALDDVGAVDASGMGDGNVTVSFAGNDGVTYTGSAGVDTVTATGDDATISTGDEDDVVTVDGVDVTVDLGEGDDTITLGDKTTVTGGDDDDTFIVGIPTTANSYSIITDLEDGETVDFGIASVADAALDDAITLQDTAQFNDFIEAATAGDGSAAGIVKWFQFQGNTYLVQDNSASAVFDAGTDSIVRLSGLIDLSDAAVSAGGVVTYNEV